MTCELTRPSPADLYNSIATKFSNNVLNGGSIIPESVEAYVVANDYAMAEEFYAIAEQQWRERDPRFACCENLIKMAADRGVFPRPAGFAQSYVKLTGVAGSLIPNPVVVQFGDLQYKSVGGTPELIPATGEIVIQIKAIEPGVAGNKISGTGVVVNPTTGLSPDALFFGDAACGGTEAEDCEAFRTRFLARMSYQPRATDEWIKAKIMEWPCVTRVTERAGSCNTCDKCNDCGCNDCQGTMEFYVLFDGTFECGLAPQSVIDEINIWLWGTPSGVGKGQVEIGVCGKLYTASPYTVNILVNGLDCVSSSQLQEIRETVNEIFKRLSPSQTVLKRTIEFAIAQVVGSTADFFVDFDLPAGGAEFTACGDLESNCDFMPCVGTITFESSVNGICSC
jgi:uncharacterized phage protein gp47/JayE